MLSFRRLTQRLERGDRGSVVLEMAVISPAILLLMVFAIYAGRTMIASSSLQEAARAAARQVSVAENPQGATQIATTAAKSVLATQDLKCTDLTVNLTVPRGIGRSVTATVECTVALGDLAVPGLPGSQHLVATFTSPIDVHRDQ